jgi:threonine/homoserine/homoserine lactone efflux protein
MNASEFAALVVFATAMSFTPGPNTTLSTTLGANFGLRRSLRFVLAVPVGWGLLLLAGAAGLGAVLDTVPTLSLTIKGMGVAYMVWLAWQLARRDRFAAPADGGFDVGFGRGVLLQFVNIKAWLAALTVSATWIAVDGQIALRIVQVLPLMMAYALASNLLYACVGASLRHWLAQGRRLLWFNRTMAIVLLVTALWVLAL